MMELRIQLIPTGEIILPPGKNGENYCNHCKVSSHAVGSPEAGSGVTFFHSPFHSNGFPSDQWVETQVKGLIHALLLHQ